jgi:hypothetical protein
MADGDASLKDLYLADSRTLTDDQLRRIKDAPDDELMRMSGTAHLVPVIEAMRRLRETIAAEERTIKRLTGVLVAFTAILVVIAAVDYWAR